MASKCGKCGSDVAQTDLSIKCVDCKTGFHPACTQFGSHQNFTKSRNKVQWKCDKCSAQSVSSGIQQSSANALMDKQTMIELLNSFKTDIQVHTDSAVGSVNSRLDSLAQELHAFNKKIDALETNQSALQERCNVLDQANSKLVAEVRALQDRLHDTEQHSRCANIEILGLPTTREENVYVALSYIAAALGINFRREDISIAHRLRQYSAKHTFPPIIAQFVSRSTKEMWLAAARKKKTLKSTEVNARLVPNDVYINHHLTANNKALLGRARRMQREKKIYFAAYMNGKVLIKHKERDDALRITTQEDLDKFDN